MNSELATPPSVPDLMRLIGAQARAAELVLRTASTAQKNKALLAGAEAISANRAKILAANGEDMHEARERKLTAALLDRLKLGDKRVAAMAAGLRDIAALDDPI